MTHLHIQRLQRVINVLRHHRRPLGMAHKLLRLADDLVDPVLHIARNGPARVVVDLVDREGLGDILDGGGRVDADGVVCGVLHRGWAGAVQRG